MDGLPLSFERERDRAVERLTSLAPRQWVVVGGAAASGVAASLGGIGLPLWARLFPVVLLSGVAGFMAVTFRQRNRKLGQRLAGISQPELWVRSPAQGLVAFCAEGIFLESERRFIAYEPQQSAVLHLEGPATTYELRLASISYEEAAHAIKLQLVGHHVEGEGRDEHRSLVVPLTSEVTPEHALKVAVEANRQAARAA